MANRGLKVGDPIRIRHNLCDPSRDVRGWHFNCADKADNATVFTCTGSQHLHGIEIRCTCDCHRAEYTDIFYDRGPHDD